jgi:glycosyltransferase involved in cell wall biosynthesis
MIDFVEKFKPEFTIPKFGMALGIKREVPGRVLHISAGNLFGGVEKMLVTLAKQKNLWPGMASSFATCFEGRLKEELLEAGAPFNGLFPASFRNPFSIYRSRRKLEKLLTPRPFDWVVCHGVWTYALFGPVIRRTGQKSALMLHGILSQFSFQDYIAKKTRPDLVIANSKSTVDTAAYLFPGVPVKICYPPCELVVSDKLSILRENVRSRGNVAPNKRIILSAGRFEAGKGFDILIQALGKIKSLTNWECWIAGEPQRTSDFLYLKTLKETVLRLGLESRINWLGYVKNMLPLYAAADVYCQANSLPESFGLTFIEAQAAGCPVITTGIGGAIEAVNNCWPNVLVSEACPDLFSKALEKKIALAKIIEIEGVQPDTSFGLNQFLGQFAPENIVPMLENHLKKAFPEAKSVLHIGAGNIFGGIENTFVNLCRFQKMKPGLKNIFAIMFSGRLQKELENLELEIHKLPTVKMRYPWQVYSARKALANLLEKEKPGCVIIHSFWIYSIFGTAVRKKKIPLVLWIHDKPRGKTPNRSWDEYFSAKLQPDLILANSNYSAQGVPLIYPGRTAKIIYPFTFIDQKENRHEIRLKFREGLGCQDSRRVVLITSRFDEYKGHQMLMDALGKLGGQGDWECWVANEPQNQKETVFKASLVEKTKKLGIENRVRWLANVAKISEIYAAADVFCQPNISPEPFGQVFIEAQLLGCPVITFEMGGTKESVWPGGLNRLLLPNDMESLVRELREFLVTKTVVKE